MELYLIKTIQGLKPLYDSDYEALKKIHIGEEVRAKVTRPRNIRFHKKFFALLNIAFANQNKTDYKSLDILRAVYTMKAGFYTEITTDKGRVYLPKSIAFSNMDEIEFTELYNRMLDVVVEEIGSERNEIIREINEFM